MTQFLSSISQLRLTGAARGVVTRPNFGAAAGTLSLYGYARPHIPQIIINPGATGYLRLNGKAQAFLNEPYGSFRDFAHYPSGALDPAMVLLRGHNGGATTSDVAQTSGYRRYFTIASPPVDYPVSGGKRAWGRAAYASVGLKFKGLVNNGFQFIDGAQSEVAKYGATTAAPYQPARSLNCIVSPCQLNYCRNPRAGTGVAGWTQSAGGGTAALSRITGSGNSLSDTALRTTWTGNAINRSSGMFNVSAASSCFPGDITSIAAWVRSSRANRMKIQLWFLNVDNVVVKNTDVGPVAAVLPNTWVQLKCENIIAPLTTTHIYVVIWTDTSGILYQSGDTFDVTALQWEKTPAVGPYLDGALGSDYLWAGTADASESFFYPDRINRSYLMSQLLLENCPLGVIPGTPQFGVVPMGTPPPSFGWRLGDPSLSVLGTSTRL